MINQMITSLLKLPYLRLKYRFFPSQAQEFWAQELLNAQGLSAKLGQVLAQGQKSKPPKSSMTPAEASTLFKMTFARDIRITQEALAASMGQVFFVTIEGEPYALKFLHPGIKDKLKKEIDNLLLLGGHFARAKSFSFDKNLFRRFLTEVFEEETDLVREAQYQQKFHEHFKHDPRFHIPQVIAEFSNSSILCQELVPAQLACELKVIPHDHIFDFFFTSLLTHGVLHGDLNDRNWGLGADERVVIYDYGCSQIISERRIGGLIKLLANREVKEGFRELGVRLEASSFKNREQELRDALFAPLFEETITPGFSLSAVLQEKFGDEIRELRGLTDPWVLLMMRSLFSLIRVYQDRGFALNLGPLVALYLTPKEVSMKATQIKIQVLEDRKEVVAMTMPMSALENLDMLMPEKVSAKIKEDDLKISQIIEKVKASDFAAQELFHLCLANRHYRVWIE